MIGGASIRCARPTGLSGCVTTPIKLVLLRFQQRTQNRHADFARPDEQHAHRASELDPGARARGDVGGAGAIRSAIIFSPAVTSRWPTDEAQPVQR